jgi:serine/threonine-protein kinase RsbW
MNGFGSTSSDAYHVPKAWPEQRPVNREAILPKQPLVIRLDPRIEAVTELLDRVEAYAKAMKLPSRTAHRLTVICEELVSNVAMHGARGKGGATYVEITIESGSDGLHLSVEDDGPPFDPLVRAAPDITLGVADRKIGGLGIYFVRSMVASIDYERREGRNYLSAVLDNAE